MLSPMHWDDQPFELIVSNPPYSIKWAGDENPLLINDPRFAPAGVLAPKSKADFAFVMHALAWLATNGTAAIVCFPGIMYDNVVCIGFSKNIEYRTYRCKYWRCSKADIYQCNCFKCIIYNC